MQESKYKFCEYSTKNWSELRMILNNLKNWVYRGQSNFDWSLSTSLERSTKRFNFDTRATADVEKVILSKFQRRANSYLNHIPNIENSLEWLSIIQHYGGPTRLLDFSHSFYVATFFALDNSYNDASIYCLNTELLKNKGIETEKSSNNDIKYEFGSPDYCNEAINQGVRSPLVMLTEPNIFNERLAAQQGLFAIPFEVNQTFEYNLSLTVDPYKKDLPQFKDLSKFKELPNTLLYKDCILLKIKIPFILHKEIRQDLAMMNINSATLYPGLEGFAKSLHLEFDKPITNEVIEFAKFLSKQLINKNNF